MKKRFLAVLLCAIMALSFGACGNSNTDDTQQDNDKNVKHRQLLYQCAHIIASLSKADYTAVFKYCKLFVDFFR